MSREENQNCAARNSKLKFLIVPKCIIDMLETRTIEAQIVQKLKNNEVRPKFTGSCKKKKRVCCI